MKIITITDFTRDLTEDRSGNIYSVFPGSTYEPYEITRFSRHIFPDLAFRPLDIIRAAYRCSTISYSVVTS
jgi:hypothetical protein